MESRKHFRISDNYLEDNEINFSFDNTRWGYVNIKANKKGGNANSK